VYIAHNQIHGTALNLDHPSSSRSNLAAKLFTHHITFWGAGHIYRSEFLNSGFPIVSRGRFCTSVARLPTDQVRNASVI